MKKSNFFARIASIALLTALCSLTGCFLFSSKKEAPGQFASKKGSKESAVVQVVSVRKETMPRTVEATATLEGLTQVDVYSRVNGRLTSLNFKEGDAVKRGQVLFKVDRTDPGENFMATPVESPVNGWVARWLANEGTQISTQTPIAQIVDDHILKATISLPSKEWAQISQRTEVMVEANSQWKKAKVSSIARAADPSSGRGTFEIVVENSSRQWRAGTTGAAKIKIDWKPRMLVPAQAVILTDQGAFVYVVDNGVALRKPVSYEMLSNDTLEVISGLDNEAQVVITGNNTISNNSPVKVVNGKAP